MEDMNSGTSLTTSSFYGAKNKRKWMGLQNSIETMEKQFKKEKIPKPFPSRILGPSVKWEIFFRQQDAFSYSRSKSKDLHVFAFESDSFEGNSGQRLYLATSYPVFWHYYSQMDDDKRHHYEVIPEGCVCKLYFDLEFDRTLNPAADGDAMVETFIQVICAGLSEEYSLIATRREVLDLDSSTEVKFSRHLIFQLQNAAFKDNIHAGRFVSHILSQVLLAVEQGDKDAALAQNMNNVENNQSDDVIDSNNENGNIPCLESKAEDVVKELTVDGLKDNMKEDNCMRNKLLKTVSLADLGSLFVQSKHGEMVLFCDTGVYTKYRNFRLFKSSKLQKKNPLNLSEKNLYTPTLSQGQSTEEAVFFYSLIANVKYSSALRVLTFETETEMKQQRKRHDTCKKGEATIDGYSKSPYPEVDEYIISLITQDSGKGVIRHWTYFQEGELLVYEITRYRYCHNIGRHHKSNNVMLIADLQRGVFYQKCHDPDCHMQNYKSPEWPLPRHVLPASYFDDLEEEGDNGSSDMDDEELLNSTLELEKHLQHRNPDPENTCDDFEDGSDEIILQSAVILESSLGR
ncbi:DNA-directed primase/polymerase protein-like [Mya arenaria]|uniref:DNA-directed primase/polymerase protein-like n=1 Tax=Mya arenaria TaxID=6604 RepID=UPI0022E8B511|nr:DNA-directed primase/polymerase protein-like [Mya arenaria]XP_052768233.1 DNA-directed primase/polymerase protein-like [Mya arenaria]